MPGAISTCAAMIAEFCPWPVYFANDITAACAAELMFGTGSEHIDYLYIFIGSFIGGGLVLNGHLFPGRTQNAGALGSMPARPFQSGSGSPAAVQLMNVASIYVLERKLIAAGRNADILWQSPDDWGDALGAVLDEWIEEVAESLAYAIVAAVAVIDVQSVLIDGAFPTSVRDPHHRQDRGRPSPGSIARDFPASACSRAASAMRHGPWAAPRCRCSPTSPRIAKCCSRTTPERLLCLEC